MNRLLIAIGFIVVSGAQLALAQQSPAGDVESLQQLERAIDQVVAESGTPGIAVGLLQPDGEIWQYTSGSADVAAGRAVTTATQFRIGSISKMFVSLAVLQLQEAGALNLNDRLSDLAPEIEYRNLWEERYPVRLAHLLNHSTGWDAPHFAEQVARPGKLISTGEALALHPHSRTSRWAPGTRTAYNNTGPLVAAYIVEKVSGLAYEDYIRQNFFEPLAMQNSGYFYSDSYHTNAAKLYRDGRELPYWHLNNRAAGGMHSTLNDMVRFARMLVRRGRTGQKSILSAESVALTEQPQWTLAAEVGLQLSWGLGNNMFHRNGVVFYGHEGSLPGASALLAYQVELGEAHIVMANTRGPAVARVHQLIADYVTRDVHPQPTEPVRRLSREDQSLSGYYRVASPVMQQSEFLTSLVPWSLNISGEKAVIRPLVGGIARNLVAGPGGSFKQESTGKIALVKVTDPVEGEVLHYGPQTLRKTGAIAALAPSMVLILWLATALIALLFAVIWLPRYLFGHIEKGAQITLRLWPLLAVLAILLALAGVKMALASPIPFALAGRVSLPSLLVFFGTLAFFGCALWSLHIWWRYRGSAMNSFVKYHSSLLMLLNLLVGLYLLGHGVIGLRLWA